MAEMHGSTTGCLSFLGVGRGQDVFEPLYTPLTRRPAAIVAAIVAQREDLWDFNASQGSCMCEGCSIEAASAWRAAPRGSSKGCDMKDMDGHLNEPGI